MYHVLSMSYTYKRCCIYRLNRHIDQTLIKTGHNVPRFILGASAKCLLSRSKLSSILGNNNMLSQVCENKHDLSLSPSYIRYVHVKQCAHLSRSSLIAFAYICCHCHLSTGHAHSMTSIRMATPNANKLDLDRFAHCSTCTCQIREGASDKLSLTSTC